MRVEYNFFVLFQENQGKGRSPLFVFEATATVVGRTWKPFMEKASK